MSKHENYDISEMREYFCTKFCSFVSKTTVQKCAALRCIYLACTKLTETQTSGMNYATDVTYALQISQFSCLGILCWLALYITSRW